MGQQQQQNQISGDIFTQDGIVVAERTFVAATDQTRRSSSRFLNEESSQHKYLAFPQNYYNNR